MRYTSRYNNTNEGAAWDPEERKRTSIPDTFKTSRGRGRLRAQMATRRELQGSYVAVSVFFAGERNGCRAFWNNIYQQTTRGPCTHLLTAVVAGRPPRAFAAQDDARPAGRALNSVLRHGREGVSAPGL